MALLVYLNPFKILRDFVRLPIEAFFGRQYLDYKKKTNEGINSVKEILLRAGILLVFLSAILWISIFMYVIFYYIYMPNVTHIRPVHLQFKPCEEQIGVCSFPSAHVQLTRRTSLLMSGQPYRIKLVLDMPETQINKDLGMFMVCAQLRAKGGVFVSSSCRAAMIRYRSKLHHLIRTTVFSPMLLSGLEEEKQQIHVELFSDFIDDPEFSVTDAYIEVQSRFVQVYGCELHVQAHFSGLRYIMYYWPRISALIGISTNLFFVSLIFILSWYHLQEGLPEFIKSKFGEKEIKKEESIGKIKLEQESKDFPFFEDEALLQEFQKLEQKKA
ncbi:PREDICTED: seipin isoform X2 [Papilio xuthus]|uniref:Seipin n=1 Tax=Papilio xuthus TaxID=66420 RepID=A0AAJ6ZT29_PAPXU|nr:PREDICTED: seipin isoform X2 [Papilio xuthus]